MIELIWVFIAVFAMYVLFNEVVRPLIERTFPTPLDRPPDETFFWKKGI